MSASAGCVCLIDVDNTLLNNDDIEADLKHHLQVEFGPESRDRYWAILEALRDDSAMRTIWARYNAIASTI